MNLQQKKDLQRVDRLVKAAGQNIIDAIGVIKEMKQTNTQITIEPLTFAKAAENLQKNSQMLRDVAISSKDLERPTTGGHPSYVGTKDGTYTTYTMGVDMGIPGAEHSEAVKREYHQEPIVPEELPPALERKPGESKYAYKQRLKRHHAYQEPDDFDIDLHDDSDYQEENTPELQRNGYTSRVDQFGRRKRERIPPYVPTGEIKPSRYPYGRGSHSKNHGKKSRNKRLHR